MEKFLEYLKAFLATQLNYIPALCVIFALYFGILKKGPTMWKLALLAILPFGFYLIRRFVNNIALFFVLHLLWAAWPILIATNLTEKIIFLITAVVYCAVSIYFKVTKHALEDGVLYVAMTALLAIVAYFFSASISGESKAMSIAILAIVYVVYFVIHEYMTGYINYIRNNEVSNQSIPKKHIFKTSISALLGFTTLFVGFSLLVLRANWFSGVIDKIRALIEKFIIWLLSFAPDAMEQAWWGEGSQNVDEVYQNVTHLEPKNELPPEVNEAVGNIVTVGAYIIAVVVVLALAYAIFRAIVAAFKVKHEENEEEIVLVKEKVTKINKKEREKKAKESHFSKDKKIRKMYEDIVWKKNLGPKPDKNEKAIVANRLSHQTPKEQCRYLLSGEAIRRMYEKARYSGQEMTKDDVRAMKEICTLEAKKSR